MRPLETEIPSGLLQSLQRGVMTTKYRGVVCLKSPFDLALYLQLFSRGVPRTVFEVGTRFGGSALWFADMMDNHGVPGRVITVDVEPPSDLTDTRITFLRGDAKDLGGAFRPEHLQAPRPWLIVEDSSHMYAESTAVLHFFHPHLRSGDYVVIEDGVVAFMDSAKYGKYQNGPTRAVEDFTSAFPEDYELDTSLCDHFGLNVTYNPNSWLRRR